MKSVLAAVATASLLTVSMSVCARGVSPYLPLNLEPEMERQIERVLILGDQPVLTRPIPAATVLDALPKACRIDERLCRRVERYLSRFMKGAGLTHASVEAAATSGSDPAIPNRYGMGERSPWNLSAQGLIQPNDYLLLNGGVVAYEGRTNLSGTMLSVGFSKAQLDIGFRPMWLSPLSGSSMLMSTEAPTMPSVTLSNYEPLTRLGIKYQIFAARMSESHRIYFEGADRTGNPDLAGAHLSIEPVSGWSLGVNRLMQYGGAGRPSSIKDLLQAFFNPSKYDNPGAAGNVGFDQQFGNEQASITSTVLFPGRVPFAIYAEYAGEDTSRGKSYLLGNSALSVGIRFPRLFRRFDLTLETSEWQNGWYVHEVYQDGMTNYGHVIGNWGADQRVFGDGLGARSYTARLGWEPSFGGLAEVTYRTLENQTYSVNRYQRYRDLSVAYSRPWAGVVLGGQLDTGQDVFGASFTRVAAFVRFDGEGGRFSGAFHEADDDAAVDDGKTQLFVDAGVNSYRVREDLTDSADKTNDPRHTGPHFAIGARRLVSKHNDLGTRLEWDQVNGHTLLGLRLLDYRYRFKGPLAVTAFLGASRYSLGTPAYGLYYGAGLQWRNVLPGWDIGVEYRYDDSIARDKLLPNDPPIVNKRPDEFFDVSSTRLYVSFHF